MGRGALFKFIQRSHTSIRMLALDHLVVILYGLHPDATCFSSSVPKAEPRDVQTSVLDDAHHKTYMLLSEGDLLKIIQVFVGKNFGLLFPSTLPIYPCFVLFCFFNVFV